MRVIFALFGLLIMAAGAVPGAAGMVGFGFSIIERDTSYVGRSALMLAVGLVVCGIGLFILLRNMQRMSFNGTKVFGGGFFVAGSAFFSWVFVTNLSMTPTGLLLFAGLAILFAAIALSIICQRQDPLAAIENALAA